MPNVLTRLNRRAHTFLSQEASYVRNYLRYIAKFKAPSRVVVPTKPIQYSLKPHTDCSDFSQLPANTEYFN